MWHVQSQGCASHHLILHISYQWELAGAGAYGASCAFSAGITSKAAPQQSLRGSSSKPPASHGIPGAAMAASGIFVAAAVQNKRASKRGVQARAVEDEELLFQPGERVTLTGPPAMAGKQGTVVAPALGDAFSVRFDSGSVFNIEIHNIQGSGVAPPAAAPVATSYAAPATYAAPAAMAAPASGDDEELLFQPGERVTLTGPPAMAGKQGSVIGPALGDAFAIQFDSGSVFNIEIHNIQGSGVAPPAAAPVATSYAAPAAMAAPASGDDEELLFQPGERVTLTGPPAMAGKQGSVIGPALGDAFAIQFDSGSVFNIEIHNIQGSGVAPPAAAPVATSYAAPAAMAAPASGDDEELLFQPGERVTLTGPPAMAGKQGSVIGPALGDAFAIQFDSGSVFNIEIHNIQGSGVAPPAAAPVATSYAAPAATTSYAAPAAAPAASGDGEDFSCSLISSKHHFTHVL